MSAKAKLVRARSSSDRDPTTKKRRARTTSSPLDRPSPSTELAAKFPSVGAKRLSPRPKRGTPADTRARLVEAASSVFNRDGFEGTDSNRIAHEAGYSAGVFYKHFPDKTAIFIAVYAAWVAQEWREVEALLAQPNADTPRELVAVVLGFHQRWRVFRRSLRALASRDPDIKRGHLQGRKRQLDSLARLRGTVADRGRRARDMLLLYTLERVADAFAEDELGALGVNEQELVALLESLVAEALPY